MAGVLALWPEDPRTDLGPVVLAAKAAAPEREPIDVIVVGGHEVETVSHMRIDNAAEVRSDLGLPGGASTDRIVRTAFERWGIEFPRRLAGDFSWVHWDPESRNLTLVRDHMGIRPLLYARYRDGFAVASDLRCLRALPGVDLTLDEFYISMLLTDFWLNREASIYRGIKRLPGGHTAIVRDFGRSARISPYFQLSRDELRLPSDRDYVDRFRDLFLEAVRCRVPVDGGVATELSGGLDSTVVTAATANLLAPDRRVIALAGSFAEDRYEGGRHDEGKHREWARGDTRIDLVEEPGSTMISEAAITRLSAAHGVPIAPFMDLVRLRLWEIAHARGASVLLDGHDGDTTVNYGFARLIELARSGHFMKLASEFAAAYRKAGEVGFKENAFLFVHPFFYTVRNWFKVPQPVQDCVGSPMMLERSGFIDAVRSYPQPRLGDVRDDHILDIHSPLMAHAIERLEVTAMAAGVEVRHPFSDRRLIEFTVSLPSHLKFRHRVPRWVERAALDGLGPSEVIWRHDKGRMPSELAYDALAAVRADDDATFAGERQTQLLSMEAIIRARARWLAEGDLLGCYALYPGALLARFLNKMP